MTIQITTNWQTEDWDNYVLNHPYGTLFHLTAWKNAIEKTFGHKSIYLAAEDGSGICGILPLFEIKSLLFGHYLISVPFAEIGGPLTDSTGVERALVDRALELAGDIGVQYFEMRNRYEIQGFQTKSLYYNFKKEIHSDHDANLKAIPRKSRAMVRNAIKKGLTYDTGHHLVNDFYKILSLNYHRLGTPVFPKKLFTTFIGEYKESCDILVVRTDKGELAAAVMFFIYKDQMVPYYAGSDFSFRRLGPNDFKYWQLMCLAVEKECTIFDYGRSKVDTGSFSFKKHWGFESRPLAYQYHLVTAAEIPNLSPANPKYRKKIQLWQKMPHGLVNAMGPFISRYLA